MGTDVFDIREGLADLPIAAGLPAAAFTLVNGWKSGLEGLALGGALGFVLHVVPRSFRDDLPRSTRVVARATTGAIGGAVLGGAAPRLAGDGAPSGAQLARGVRRGMLAGAIVYGLWGLVEPRRERL